MTDSNNKIFILEKNPLAIYAFQCLFQDQKEIFFLPDSASLIALLKADSSIDDLYLVNILLIKNSELVALVKAFPQATMNTLFYTQNPVQSEAAHEKIDLLLSLGARSIILDTTPKLFAHAIDCLKNKFHFYCPVVTQHMIQAKAKKPFSFPLLTARETEVLKLLAKGMTSKQIGSQLQVGTRTVDAHRGNIMKKLKCSNAAQCIQEAFRLQLLGKAENQAALPESSL